MKISRRSWKVLGVTGAVVAWLLLSTKMMFWLGMLAEPGSPEYLRAELLDGARQGNLRPVLKNRKLINKRDFGGNTLIHLAAAEDNVRAARILLDNGADPYLHNEEGRLPFHTAAESGSRGVVDLFIARKIDPTIYCGGRWRGDYQTPRMIAASHGYMDIADRLLNYEMKWRKTDENHGSSSDGSERNGDGGGDGGGRELY